MKLEDIKRGLQLSGVIPGTVVTVVASDALGPDAFELVYKTPDGKLGERTLLRSEEPSIEIALINRNWDLSAPAPLFKLALEAFRMRVAYLFDPMMAVHTSNVEPLPHQISAVYEQMLPRMPLRYVLADDPGAGKTIMAGLLIQELLIRADVRRVLIVSPGSLTEQWQDELWEKFGLHFEIFSREKQEQSASGNYFVEQERVIVRLDQLSRNEENQKNCVDAYWDLVIVDEAHKMSANYFGNKVNETKRFNLGKALGAVTRHFLLMTATPHNGKDADFQLFLSLLDSDRFYGKFRDGVHKVDINDIMRRMVKEELLRFDGTRLFPERKAYTINYLLSDLEVDLYNGVTNYVSTEMGRAENLDGKRKGNVGFALTILQRRLASSPEAIYQSLKRRCSRLDEKLKEMKIAERNNHLAETLAEYGVLHDVEIPDDIDESEDELTAEEYEAYTDKVVDQATAARTIKELEAEIALLQDLTKRALIVAQSGSDRKWEELSRLLQDTPEMRTVSGNLRKLIIFTEHKDTLNYLTDRITNLLGSTEAVVTIHGGTARDQRRLNQSEFRNNPNVLVMVATDAAGEGVNLQNANLMINYDLPWNPNRLEQRFGRIHRIGQTEVCHLWNLVASETREGAVFTRLFEKLEIERAALGGRVFDILGEAFEEVPLKQLLIEAIRYGELPETKAKLKEKIEGVLDTGHLKELIKRNALTEQHMSMEELYTIREEMEKAEARKLQPYFIKSFFEEAFKAQQGEMRVRETGRFEIRHVPAAIRERDRIIGETRTPVLKQYERICFEKELIQVHNKPMAELMHPGHPLMNSLTDIILEENRKFLKIGTILVDPSDDGIEPRMFFMIDHVIRESTGDRQVSRRLQFVTIHPDGTLLNAGWAPHLDLIEPTNEQRNKIESFKNLSWLNQNIEQQALAFATEKLVPEHFNEVRERRERQATKLLSAVHERLTKEIDYHQDRYVKLKEDVAAGRQPRMQPENARRTAEELVARLQQRTKEIEQMRHVVSSTPVILGGALVVPIGYFNQESAGGTLFSADAAARALVERIAMNAVIDAELALGHRVKDVSVEKCGWDITANQPMDEGQLKPARHIEVKGRVKGQLTITVTKNEIMTALNQQDKFILAIVIVDGDRYEGPFYIRCPFSKELDDGAVSTNYSIENLLARAVSPKETV